ncbi:PEP-CTERM sorting domain-containing protein [Deferrisoma sp.]
MRFDVSDTPPAGGFYLVQDDPVANTTLYFSSSLQVVPEPGTLLLVGSGLAGLAGWRRRRARG